MLAFRHEYQTQGIIKVEITTDELGDCPLCNFGKAREQTSHGYKFNACDDCGWFVSEGLSSKMRPNRHRST